MKRFYISIATILVLTVLAVLFVPGVDDFVEQTFQRYLGRAARWFRKKVIFWPI